MDQIPTIAAVVGASLVMADEARRLEPFTIEMTASELPESIVSRLPERPPADARLVVTIEPAESENEKLAALQRDLQAGLDDLAEGRVSEGADVFVRLKARFPG
jgi:hypothetical protein